MKKYLVCLLCGFFLMGCAGTLTKIKTWQRVRLEDNAFFDAAVVLQAAVPAQVLKECGYRFNAPLPATTPVVKKQLWYMTGRDVHGIYKPNEKMVYYLKGNSDALTHEFIHYFNDTSKRTRICLDEVSAYLGVYGTRRKEDVEYWKRRFRRERNRNKGMRR